MLDLRCNLPAHSPLGVPHDAARPVYCASPNTELICNVAVAAHSVGGSYVARAAAACRRRGAGRGSLHGKSMESATNRGSVRLRVLACLRWIARAAFAAVSASDEGWRARERALEVPHKSTQDLGVLRPPNFLFSSFLEAINGF